MTKLIDNSLKTALWSNHVKVTHKLSNPGEAEHIFCIQVVLRNPSGKKNY